MKNCLFWKPLVFMLILGCLFGCGGDDNDGSIADSSLDDKNHGPTITSAIVDIPDKNLRNAIMSALNLPVGTIIIATDMQKLSNLDVLGKDISSLTGLEHATNLERLYLDSNDIVDISPLAGLTNLERLYLNSNAIVDISPLAGLTNLESLDIFSNDIVDISPLAGLTNLERLYLDSNAIGDVCTAIGN